MKISSKHDKNKNKNPFKYKSFFNEIYRGKKKIDIKAYILLAR